ncbi:hypothetical protein LZ009_05685 [Ramlibacter sp. XY19]|uniref:hypothetical protein n=1 Tax=Ramlibacter paludis TaxID=2908000 RepID=UPI0023DB2461|nr:hypothetical protein [Ramlibacter paludis]MCG2592269.1 hypothetical protein [Ramlibacter paludis]
MIELAVLLLVSACAGLVLWSGLKSGMTAHLERRERAMQQFRGTVFSPPGAGLRFDGAAATILASHETHYLAGLMASNYVLTVRARMPDGTEFQFKSDPSGQPWVTCLSRGDRNATRVRAAY